MSNLIRTALIWVAFFGATQALGWLFYWRVEEPRFPEAHKHSKPTLVLEPIPDPNMPAEPEN